VWQMAREVQLSERIYEVTSYSDMRVCPKEGRSAQSSPISPLQTTPQHGHEVHVHPLSPKKSATQCCADLPILRVMKSVSQPHPEVFQLHNFFSSISLNR